MRITAAKNPIEGLRTPQEAERWLSKLQSELVTLTKPVDALLKTLAREQAEAAGESFDVIHKGRTIKVKEMFKPADAKVIKAITDQYAKLDTLLTQQDTLSEFLVRAPALFRGQKGAQKLIQHAQEVKTDTVASIGRVRTLLNKLSSGSQPVELRKISAVLEKHMPSVLKYGSMEKQALLSVDPKGQPVFYTYLELSNVQGEQSYAQYCVVLSHSPLDGSIFLTTLRAFELPNRFPRGIKVQNAKDEKKLFQALHKALIADGVASELRKGVPDDAADGLTDLHESIIKSKVEDNFIWVKVKSYDALPVKDLHAVLTSKFTNALFNISQVKFKVGVGYRIAVLPKSGGIDQSKLADLKEALELSDDDLNALKQLLMKR